MHYVNLKYELTQQQIRQQSRMTQVPELARLGAARIVRVSVRARGGFGPRAGAAVLSDTTGLTWAEMRRTGLLQRSASDAVIQPARMSQW